LRPEADKALKLYNNRSIANYKTVLKIITQLSGRGGSQSSAIESIKKYEKKPSDFKKDMKSEIKNMFAKGRTSMMNADKQIKNTKTLIELPKYEYYITGLVNHVTTSKFEGETFHSKGGQTEKKTYFTTTKQEAINKFKNDMKKKHSYYASDIDSITKFKNIDNLKCKNITLYNRLPKYEYYLTGIVHYDELWVLKEKTYKYSHKLLKQKHIF
jgi:hypothetical protein